MSASSSAIQRAISSAEKTRGSGNFAPSARSREARNSISSCFSAGESETAAASISASGTIRTSVHPSGVFCKARVPCHERVFRTPSSECGFLRSAGAGGLAPPDSAAYWQVLRDASVVAEARRDALALFERDPLLADPQLAFPPPADPEALRRNLGPRADRVSRAGDTHSQRSPLRSRMLFLSKGVCRRYHV